MAIPPIAPIVPSPVRSLRSRILGSTRLVILFALLMALAACLVFAWLTRGAMANFSFLNNQRTGIGASASKKTIVDLSPWQTAEALAPLAVTAEEKEFAHDAQRLADHDVDRAFASALRQAMLQAQHTTLSGDALALSQKVAQLQQLIKQDQAQVQNITQQLSSPSNEAKNGAPAPVDNGDLDVAKAQLGLDTDELADAQQDLDRTTGDQTAQIQAELAAHEAAMQAYDKQVQAGGDIAVVSARREGTMASRVQAWFAQRSRSQLLQQAIQQTQADIQAITLAHNALEAKANAGALAASPSGADHSARLAIIKDRAAQRQILSIYDDRIQTKQQLATVYGKWAAQVQLQHRIVLHLILQSLALITFICICMVLCDALVRRLMDNPALDRRRSQTMRSILVLAIQVIGVVLILLVIFGSPKETPTILGLATAALTIALQDFIIAFLGWFVLIGKNGIHVGDWVEINGVGGEVIEVRLFSTTLLETGTLADRGLPTGRRITFMNGFAIRGQYFNFSTSGQWMWDEITLNLPASDNIHEWLDRIQKVVLAETEKNANLAEQEWKRGAHGTSLSRFSATAVENLRPSASGIEVLVRYVTRASERFELRNRLYQKLLEMLREPEKQADPGAATLAQNR
jgi:small-conductance mechanosensitive channel